MRKFRIVAVVFLIVSCSVLQPRDEVQIDAVRIAMGTINQRMRGYLYRKEMNGDLSSLTTVRYRAIVLSDFALPSETPYVTLIEKKDPELLLSAEKKNFLVCVKIVHPATTLCDSAKTAFIDCVEIGTKSRLSESLERCSGRLKPN